MKTLLLPLAVVPFLGGTVTLADSRPNIIVFCTDDHRLLSR
ncbi:hypothetical protein [Neorhodopirellula lusitana]